MADPIETNLNVDASQLNEMLPKLERAAELRQQAATAPGLRTSEGAAALLAAGAPLLSMVLGAKLDWTHVAAFAVVALVAIAYGGYRTLLKLRGLAVLAVLLLPGHAFGDEPPAAPVRAPMVAPQASPPEEPVVTKPALPGLADLALCTASTLPAAAAKCAGMAPPPDYTKITAYSVISASVTQLVQLAGAYLALRFDPDSPIGK